VRDIGVRVALYGRIFWVAFGLVAAVGTVLVYWIGGRQVIGGTMSVGTIVAFIQLLTRLYAPVTMLSNVRVEVMTALVSFERVFEVLDFPSAVSERPGAIELVEPRGQVEFDRVWFRYPHPSLISIASLEEGAGDRGYDENPGCSGTSRSPSLPAGWWRLWGRPARGRPRSPC